MRELKDLEHTPGEEWQWVLNESSKTVRLESALSGRDTIMDFIRYGMSYAQPRFNVDGIMVPAEKLGVVVDGREHHAEWHKYIDHPQAILISKAPALLALVKEAREALKKSQKAIEQAYRKGVLDGKETLGNPKAAQVHLLVSQVTAYEIFQSKGLDNVLSKIDKTLNS